MSQFNLKVSALYDFIIGDTFKLFIDGQATNGVLAKRWDGSKWVLVYEVSKRSGNQWGKGALKYFDGSVWKIVSIL